jgi:hypothetical protein
MLESIAVAIGGYLLSLVLVLCTDPLLSDCSPGISQPESRQGRQRGVTNPSHPRILPQVHQHDINCVSQAMRDDR